PPAPHGGGGGGRAGGGVILSAPKIQRPPKRGAPERPKPASAGFGQRNFNRGEFIPLSSHSVNMGKPVFI
ncbi:hypothetical protein EJ653_19315, partial [Pseudomonas aeruginosa]